MCVEEERERETNKPEKGSRESVRYKGRERDRDSGAGIKITRRMRKQTEEVSLGS